ncbi:MAG: type III-A CRISPR-associated protein Cas10/Csm1 [Ignavibacteriaceae bacterium]|nr:type III-A CRISPR-associated protein Cas10/Csm1 [Ignavibacteriaceae bacterium]
MANENNRYTAEEKILILAGLFHDIGKFEQRCTDTRIRHQELGERFVKEFDEEFLKILDGKKEDFEKLCTAIRDHHSKNADELTRYIRQADHLSSSQRVELDSEDLGDKPKWGHKYLSSVFAKLALNAPEDSPERKEMLRYYRQKPLTEANYHLMIPDLEDVTNEALYRYGAQDYKNFEEDLSAIFSVYETPEDFDTLIRLLMLYFEKYLWCVPDFTGSEETDISLYNHSKDVAAAAHALYKADTDQDGNKKLNLVIGDIPGIQNYIFDITNTKPAKVLRGRSVFVQVLTRVFASRFLEELGLSEVSVIMLAGGKFYILAPEHKEFSSRFQSALGWCEEYMKENFSYELSFSAGYASFDPVKLKDKEVSFGDIVEQASHHLLEMRSSVWAGEFFGSGGFSPVLPGEYIHQEDAENIKCAITGKPIRENRHEPHIETDEENNGKPKFREIQAGNELKLGKSVLYGSTVITYDKEFSQIIDDILELEKMSVKVKEGRRIIINPDYDKFNKFIGDKVEIIRGSYFLHVANYASKDEKGNVMPFDEIEKTNQGAKLLTMIKGDIDNLGLLMATGLYSDGRDYTGFSRTTSLSYHLRYFFSTFFNNFLKDWESRGEENKVYTVFAGGDDLLFIAPHGSALALLHEINKKFTEFSCANPEVHISYSLTNFKHSTPVRLVNELAEESQKKSKNKGKMPDLTSPKCFYPEENKASVVVHDTVVKLNDLRYLQNLIEQFIIGAEEKDTRNPVSRGLLRDLLQIGEIIKEYERTGNTSLLFWHPLLTYKINRNVKDRAGNYYNEIQKEIFEKLVSVDIQNPDLKQHRELLYAAVCETIYKIRK